MNALPSLPIKVWRCPNCGQLIFADAPPDLCSFCHDFTTWQLIHDPSAPPDEPDPLPPTRQLPLFE